ncbi:ABC transporter ATP-binding protein [Marinobacterium arenosum]|uniref:ABC transporter ATP-binding protein n=1 Tax=Marinobacterium arenosum TaxID=2862496 RepID=UPI001C985D4E|nr:ABC transporter ATP-binding protein [Marinobacterium arenosum]MBY4677026.1 ABC transporter ATP-binding protein [Marinobacterium arenosum]
MIEVIELSRRYGDFVAVDKLSFEIGGGEIVGLLGHNGAGKTTIMKMLSGYLEPSSGRVWIDGIELGQQPRAVQRRLGYLPENLPVYPEMLVADYLDYAARLKGLRGSPCRDEIRRAVKATDIGSKLLAPIATLSRGFKQRVGVAQAILGRPRLLILDEPTNGLDPAQTQQMRSLIRELAQDATVILSTHIMQEVDALCDRVLMMRSGRLVVDAKLAELRSIDQLLLATDLAPGVLEPLLPGGACLQHSSQQDGHYRYRIRPAEGQPLASLSTELARAVLAADGRLIQLAPLQRDLETLFREVNEQPEVADAA